MKLFSFIIICFLILLQSAAQDSLVQQLTTYAEAAEATGRLHGYVVVKHKGRLLLSKSLGFSNYESKEKATPGTKFQIGSVTKQFTATVVLKLVEQGRLSLQDRLSKFFPEIPNADKITLAHLLNHTSGLFNYTNNRRIFDSLRTVSTTSEAMRQLFKTFQPQFEPGTKWDYSNTGYSLLGYIIEKVTGKTWEANIRAFIFQPLQLQHSGFNYKTAEPRATGYYMIDEKNSFQSVILDSSVAFAAGSIYSTPNDLIKWDESLFTEKILSAAQKKMAFAPGLNKYGYGWFADTIHSKPVLHHGGAIDGFGVQNIINLQDSTIVLVMLNAEMEHPDKIARDLLGIVYGETINLPQVSKEIQLQPEVLQRYTGNFLVNNEMKVTLKLENNKLMIAPEGQPFAQLYAETETLFFFKIMDAKIEFITSAGGAYKSFLFKQGGMVMEGKRVE